MPMVENSLIRAILCYRASCHGFCVVKIKKFHTKSLTVPKVEIITELRRLCSSALIKF